MNIEIANRLINLRKQSGLSQEELAAKLGLSRQAVSKWERAEASPDTDNLICLAKIYGVSLDDLLNTDQPVEEIAREVKEKEKEEKPRSEKAVNELIGEKGICLDWFSFDPYGFHSVKPLGDILVFYDENGNEIPQEQIVELEKNGNGVSVSIERDEITVYLADSNSRIHIEPDEVAIINPAKERIHYDIDSDGSVKMEHQKSLLEMILVPASLFLAVVAYLLLGFFLPNNDGWQCWWVVFLLLPFTGQMFDMIRHKRVASFPIVFVCLMAYFPLSYYFNLWHPLWVIFLAIPLFYTIAGPIDQVRKQKKAQAKESE